MLRELGTDRRHQPTQSRTHLVRPQSEFGAHAHEEILFPPGESVVLFQPEDEVPGSLAERLFHGAKAIEGDKRIPGLDADIAKAFPLDDIAHKRHLTRNLIGDSTDLAISLRRMQVADEE